jgi:site-specific recombinase XerD
MVTMKFVDVEERSGAELEIAFGRWIYEHGRSQKTVIAYRQGVRMFQRWFEKSNHEDLRLYLLNSWDLRAWREYSLDVERVKPATWNLRRAGLMALCLYAREIGEIENDPAKDLAGVKEEEQPPHWLNDRDFGKLMRQLEIDVNKARTSTGSIRALRDRAMVMVMMHAGMREAEAANLLIEDIHLSERKGSATIHRGKGDKHREVPLNSEARRALSEYMAVIDPHGGCSPHQDPHPALSRGERRRKEGGDRRLFDLGIRAIQKRIEVIGKAAGIEGLRPHRLRHTCAKRMVDGGVALTAVQKILGHSKLETTGKYCEPGWEDMEEAVENIRLGRMAKKQ